MIEKARGRDGLNWQLPLYAGLTAFIVFIPVICKANLDVLYLFVVGPFLFLISIVWLIIATIRKKGRQFLRVLSILAVFCAVSFLLFKNSSSIRRSGRWLVWSH